MQGARLTDEQKNIIWGHYKIKIRQYPHRRKKLYEDIALLVGFCKWQTVYNVLRQKTDELQYKLFE